MSEGEIYDLRQFCQRKAFDIIYYPGIQKRDKDFKYILSAFHDYYEYNKKIMGGEEFIPSDIYHFALLELLEGHEESLYQNYIFDIRPMQDLRPYYSGYLKLSEIWMYLDNIQDISEEWGYLLQIAILILSMIFGALIILIPIIGCRKELFKKQRGTFGVIVYYACLGMGYMFIEIFLIQMLVFLLNNPIYSVSIVITSMLIISGLGNLVSKAVKLRRKMVVRIACTGIVLTIAFYIFVLPLVLNHYRSFTMTIRVIVSILVIAPGAFFLGVPFPIGLQTLIKHNPRLLPWAGGMNGSLSVTGVALAWILSVWSGFHLLLVVAAVVYIVVGIIFPVNEYIYKKVDP